MYRRSLAVRISLLVGSVMAFLLLAMAVVLVLHQQAQHTQNMQDFLLAKARLAATLGARAYATVLEEAIDNGIITFKEAFDHDYEVIEGYSWQEDAVKFHTKYDSITDKAVLAMQDKFLEDPDFLYAAGTDINGYVPTHNSRFQKPITGEPDIDLHGNRTKRIFKDKVARRAANNLEQGFLQIYHRDTGEAVWDVTSPIRVKGHHWGAFRVGIQIREIEQRSSAMIRNLSILFTAFGAVVLLVLFFLLRRAVQPIVALTAVADDISFGERLNVPVDIRGEDEVALLSKSLDRLRISMKDAIERLGGGD